MKIFINGQNEKLRKLIEDNAGRNYYFVEDYLKSNGRWFYSYIQARKKNNLPYLSKNKIIWEFINEVMANDKSIEIKTEDELNRYINIYEEMGFSEHYEVNAYISTNNIWDDFSNIRSFNYHGSYEKIQGILPQYFAEVCKRLSIKGAGGVPLSKAVSY